MDISLDQDVDSANSVKFNLFVLVIPPVAHGHEVLSPGVILLITLGQNSIRIQRLSQPPAFFGLDPGVVVN